MTDQSGRAILTNQVDGGLSYRRSGKALCVEAADCFGLRQDNQLQCDEYANESRLCCVRISTRMRSVRQTCYTVLLLLVSAILQVSSAADYSGYLVLTSDYVYRGVTYSDGHAAAQLGGDVSLDSGVYFGAWASTVDINNGPSRQRDVEMNYYLGYGHDLTNRWSISSYVVAYTYPGSSGDIDYDYIEYSLAGNYRDRIWFEYSFSPNIFHSGFESHNYSMYADLPMQTSWSIGAGIGYYDVSDFSGDGYAYWQFGVSRQIASIDLDLRYHDTDDWVPFVSNRERADARVVLSARFSF